MKKKRIVRIGIIVIATIAISVFGVFTAKDFTQDANADRGSKISAMKEDKSEEETAGITADEETSAQQAETESGDSKNKKEEKAKEAGTSQAGTQAKKQESVSVTSNSTVSRKTEAPKSKEPVKTESKPAHVHEWQAVYQTVNKEVYGIKCNGCSFVTTDAGSLYAHIDADPFDNCGSYSTGVVIRVDQEKVLTGYKCSCGATK